MRIDSGVVEPFDFRCRRRPTTNFTRPRTRSSNPVPSSEESCELPYGRRRPAAALPCLWALPVAGWPVASAEQRSPFGLAPLQSLRHIGDPVVAVGNHSGAAQLNNGRAVAIGLRGAMGDLDRLAVLHRHKPGRADEIGLA